MLQIQNDGPRIAASNFWELPETSGKFIISINSGAYRLLLPVAFESAITDMQAASVCILSRGPWLDKQLADAFELLFDDGTANPFALHFQRESFFELMIPEAAEQAKERVLTVWTQPRRGVPHLALERPCYYRIVPEIPWLKPGDK